MQRGERDAQFWQRTAARVLVGVAAAVGVWLALRYVLWLFLPFLIAWGIGCLIHPSAVWLSRHLHVPRRLCAVVLMLLVLGMLVTLVALATDRLVFELRALLTRLERDGDSIGLWLSAQLARLRELLSRLPLTGGEGAALWTDDIDELILDVLRTALGKWSARIPAWIAAAVRAVPEVLLTLAVTLIASFYVCLDPERIRRGVAARLPPALAARLPRWRQRLGTVLRQYARAYLLLLLVTFLELFVALRVLGVEYAFLIALLTALLDILPVFGVGIVLIPWGFALLLSRRLFVGFGLLVTYAVMVVVRQILEPRVVSGSLGLHPLLTLMVMYVGYRLLGIVGMLLAPAAALLLAGGGSQSCENRGVDR